MLQEGEQKEKTFFDTITCGCFCKTKKNQNRIHTSRKNSGNINIDDLNSSKISKNMNNVSYLSRKSKEDLVSEKSLLLNNKDDIVVYSRTCEDRITEQLTDDPESNSTNTSRQDLHEFQQIDYSYLMPPRSILDREITEYEIMDDGQGFRQIYFDVPTTDKEKEILPKLDVEVKRELAKLGIGYPQSWNEPDNLRFLAFCDYDIKKAVKFIIPHIQFLEGHYCFDLTDDAATLFRNGCVSIVGKCKLGRPTICWNIKKLGKIDNASCARADAALKFALCLLKKYC